MVMLVTAVVEETVMDITLQTLAAVIGAIITVMIITFEDPSSSKSYHSE